MRVRRWIAVSIFVFCGAVASRAGGPAFIAGSGYAAGVEGQPIIWANGTVQYFTDQGNLSPILTGAQADALVAAAFSAWTSIPGVALTAAQAGHLAEDVNGTNIAATASGTVTAPADITSSATSTPVGIVYDLDGTVTDALLGQGASGLADCFTNAVFGGPDDFASSGNIVHALVVINGICAATNAQLPDVQYRLVRTLGRVVGLGWSQANINVLTRLPVPTSDDFAGFPVMHFSDPISCVPIGICYTNAAAPKMDDADAMARLYPATNSQLEGRIYGSVYFTDALGTAVQPMQGVNVVARLIDTAGKASRQYVATSVSGFAFHGNAGNIVNGYVDANGLRYDRWGSNDVALEGYFDLGELRIPTGQTIAQYQLSVEGLDANWSTGLGPYAPTQVTPSGSFAPVVVTIQNGSNVERDILMLGDEIARTHPGSGSTYANPAILPMGGAWGSWMSGYGSTDWVEFTAQANRTASVAVTAVDESGAATENKLAPVIGIWQLSDQSGNPAPAATNFAFNTANKGMSRLDAQFGSSEMYRVGVADFRGDGRPDYFYQASLLYSDTVTPARLSLAGGLAILKGTGFNNRQQVSVGGTGGTTLSASANRIEAVLPAGSLDGVATIQVTDPVSGGFSQMIGALTYGASSTDLLLLLQGSETASVVGAAAANPLRVRAVAADGVTPVSGATIAWSATNGLQFSACGGAAACSVLSDEVGESASLVTPTAIGQSTVTIALAPASYTTPQTRQATVVATSSALDLVATTPTRWIGQGATLSIPLSVEALNLGAPKPNVTINFLVTNGTATLSATSATTSALGFATVNASITNQNADVQVIACVAPNNVPCQTFTLFSTPASLWKLETVTGSSQFVLTGQAFQPLVMRVTDGSVADNPVMGVNVVFNTTLAQISVDSSPTGGQQGGESAGGGGGGMPVILGSSRVQVSTAVNGVASIVPAAGNVGPCDVFIAVSAGSSTLQFQMESRAAIVLQQQPTKIGAASAAAHNALGTARRAVPESVPFMLFAIPQGELSDLPVPSSPAATPPVSSPETCPEALPSAASGSETEDVASGVCEPHAEIPGREVDAPPQAADTLAKRDASRKSDASQKSIAKPRDGTQRDSTVERGAVSE
jgi:hypothetical protein